MDTPRRGEVLGLGAHWIALAGAGPHPFSPSIAGPWWRLTCGRSVVWSSSCGSSKTSRDASLELPLHVIVVLHLYPTLC